MNLTRDLLYCEIRGPPAHRSLRSYTAHTCHLNPALLPSDTNIWVHALYAQLCSLDLYTRRMLPNHGAQLESDRLQELHQADAEIYESFGRSTSLGSLEEKRRRSDIFITSHQDIQISTDVRFPVFHLPMVLPIRASLAGVLCRTMAF